MQFIFVGAINALMKKERGVTLIELMVVISIFAILLGVGIPGLQSLMNSSRLTTSVNDFVSTISLARNEAVRRNAVVGIESVSGALDWSGGWRVFVDVDNSRTFSGGDVLIHTTAAIGGVTTVTMAAPIATIPFSSGGISLAGAPVSLNFSSVNAPATRQKVLTIALSGRVSVARQ